ncbi:hypothetical protein BLNAU_11058 [Blattamonas nauphoetae]|uniref:Uncharacterized protein n=1 Tax=Blattamonas nauphoetae TaxID=2049346 RepID=A0ABQ9XPI4_9EUKA|nr:hypothetical protein BLNAU_11058 [Blattamonas nauphoetae]
MPTLSINLESQAKLKVKLRSKRGDDCQLPTPIFNYHDTSVSRPIRRFECLRKDGPVELLRKEVTADVVAEGEDFGKDYRTETTSAMKSNLLYHRVKLCEAYHKGGFRLQIRQSTTQT